MSIESVIPSNHLILCRPLLLLPSIFPSRTLCCGSRTRSCPSWNSALLSVSSRYRRHLIEGCEGRKLAHARPYLRGRKRDVSRPRVNEGDTAPWLLTGGVGPREYCLPTSKQGRRGFPGGLGVKNLSCDAGGCRLIPGRGCSVPRPQKSATNVLFGE